MLVVAVSKLVAKAKLVFTFLAEQKYTLSFSFKAELNIAQAGREGLGAFQFESKIGILLQNNELNCTVIHFNSK